MQGLHEQPVQPTSLSRASVPSSAECPRAKGYSSRGASHRGDMFTALPRSQEMNQQQPSQPPSGKAETAVRMSRGWSLNAFRQGVDAAKARQPVSANPYDEGSDQAAIWLGGWQVGSTM